MCFCVFRKKTQKHKNTQAVWCNHNVKKKTKKHLVNVFLCFSEEKNTKTHWVSDARSVGGNHKIAQAHALPKDSLMANIISNLKKKNTKRHKTQKTHLVILCLITSHIWNNVWSNVFPPHIYLQPLSGQKSPIMATATYLSLSKGCFVFYDDNQS